MSKECILTAFHADHGEFSEPVGPIIGPVAWLQHNQKFIDKYLQNHFPAIVNR